MSKKIHIDDIKESLFLSDLLGEECRNNNGNFLRFYFVTTNDYRDFEELTGAFDCVKQQVEDVCKKKGIVFNEADVKDEICCTLYGYFYENGECDLFFTCGHYMLQNEVEYNLAEYFEKEDIDIFWEQVKETDEWIEFKESLNEEMKEM